MKKEFNSDFVRRNGQIKSYRVFVVQDGKKLGEMSYKEAQFMANDLGLDLVEISPTARPPVCSIMDYGKHQYEKTKKKSENKSHVMREKEFSLRYVIDQHDLETKMNQAKKFLSKGDRVKLTIKFKSRENAHKDQGWLVINKAVDILKDFGILEKTPMFESNKIIAKLLPKKYT